MIVKMKPAAGRDEIDYVSRRARSLGFQVHESVDAGQVLLSLQGPMESVTPEALAGIRGVETVLPTRSSYRLASLDYRQERSVVSVGGVEIGGERVAVMAGPCAVETRDELIKTAWSVKESGATLLRGGAFKPRTSPYSFQGLGEEGLALLAEAGAETGLPVVTEVMAPEQVEVAAAHADMLQIGTRNMQNFQLLAAVGAAGKPVLLKRGMMSTLEELLLAAEYVLAQGNPDVVLCERGIRSFETYTRNTLDINAVPALQELSHLPVAGDPSHSTGRRSLVGPAARALIAAGADGLLVEVHPVPEQARSDGPQSLTLEGFDRMMAELRRVADAVGRTL
ncbi:MAG: 3-deoxy-7-phosphoheptulonate synthase [Acidimicrobiia bacterium]